MFYIVRGIDEKSQVCMSTAKLLIIMQLAVVS
jgi:hypothetical protein